MIFLEIRRINLAESCDFFSANQKRHGCKNMPVVIHTSILIKEIISNAKLKASDITKGSCSI